MADSPAVAASGTSPQGLIIPHHGPDLAHMEGPASGAAVRHDFTTRTGRTLDTKLEGPVGVVCIIGGTSSRVVLVSGDGAILGKKQIFWSTLVPEEQRQNEEKLREISFAFPAFLAGEIASLVHSKGGLLGQVRFVGLSVAGPVQQDGDRSFVTTANTGVPFVHRDLGSELFVELKLAAGKEQAEKNGSSIDFELQLKHVITYNDGMAAYLGERLHPKGQLLDHDGTVIIIGTGVGGGPLGEIGHTFWWSKSADNPSGFIYKDFEKLKRKGLYNEKTGKYIKSGEKTQRGQGG